MNPKRVVTLRSVIRTLLLLGVVMVALVTSFIFSMWLSRTLSPKGEWLQNGLTAFGFPVAWLVLTLLYAHLMTAAISWLFRTIWPKPPDGDHDR